METLKSKLGPLPVWGWGVVATLGAVAVFYWRGRSSSADATNATGQAQDAQAYQDQLNALGYLGYADVAGLQPTGGGGGGGTTGGGGGTDTGGSTSGGGGAWGDDPNHRRLVKDPSGAWRVVVGFGHWYRKTAGGHWFWTPGPIPTKGAQSALHYRPGPGLTTGVPFPGTLGPNSAAAKKLEAGMLNPQPRAQAA